MTDRDTLLGRLNDVHSFPGEYMFKVIGDNTPSFVSRIVQACLNVLGPNANPEVTTRESSGNRHISVTVEAVVVDADTVLEIYELLSELDGVKFIL